MKLALAAALILVACYFVSIEYVEAQAATTTLPPPPKNKTCGRGGPRGGKRRGPPGGNAANRTTRSVDDIMSTIREAKDTAEDAAKKFVGTAGKLANIGMDKAQAIAQGKMRKPKTSTTTTAAPA